MTAATEGGAVVFATTSGGGIFVFNLDILTFCNNNMISANDQVQLDKMIASHKVVDQTDKIRDLKHSPEIRRCISNILKLRENTELVADKAKFEEEVLKENGFLFFHYMSIYNMVVKGGDVGILNQLLDILEKIELNQINQHEGSFLVGTLLKELYIDSVLRHEYKGEPQKAKPAPKEITWKQFRENKI